MENSGIGHAGADPNLMEGNKTPLRSFRSRTARTSTSSWTRGISSFFHIFFFSLRNKQMLSGERRRKQEEFAGGGLSSVAAGTGPGLRVWLSVMRFHIHPGNG